MNQLSKNLLHDLNIIEQIPAVSNILEVVCRSTGMGFSAVARVTEENWLACAVNDKINFGLKPGGELKLETTICNEIRQHQTTVVIDNVAESEQFSNHQTPLLYGFQSYISVPINLKDGSLFGTLCAIDPNPHVLDTPETIGMFVLFADLIAFHIDALKQIEETETDLIKERHTAELRDQFIAILGHDLRNPVGAILNAAQVLLKLPSDERTTQLANIVQSSSYRIKNLIENILDFARGRLGEGIILNYKSVAHLEDTLHQVVDELKMSWPDREIETRFEIALSVLCDEERVGQLLSNLLGNALSHGAEGTPILIEASVRDGKFIMCVTNQGQKIPIHTMQQLFKPFYKGDTDSGQHGLGLGLYISSEIAKAHKGDLTVSSTDQKTCFTCEIPIEHVKHVN